MILQHALNTAGIIALLVGTVIPLITALVVKAHWNREVKGIVTMFLAALTAFLAQWKEAADNDIHFDWRTVALSALLTFVVALATHFGVWKNSATQNKALATGVK